MQPEEAVQVARAKAGDAEALEALVRQVQSRVYNLALRMLWHPEDAADASQEILLKVVTRLSTFRGDSAFVTWVFRIATNHLLTMRRRGRLEQQPLSFDEFAEDLERGLAEPPGAGGPAPDSALLEEEVKLGCTLAMLSCLDRDHRLAYILGEVFALSGEQAAAVLEVDPAAFRKRLSRARQRVREFMERHCGLVSPSAPCRCARRISYAVRLGRVNPGGLLFAGGPVREGVREMEGLHEAAAIFRSHPDFDPPARLLQGVRRAIGGGTAHLLGE